MPGPRAIVAFTPPVIDYLIKIGKVVGTRVDFDSAGIGVAVKAGAPKLDRSKVDAFSVPCSTPSRSASPTAGSRLMVAKIIQGRGPHQELKARTNSSTGSRPQVGRAAASHIALQRSMYILAVAGAELAGSAPSCSKTTPSPRRAR